MPACVSQSGLETGEANSLKDCGGCTWNATEKLKIKITHLAEKEASCSLSAMSAFTIERGAIATGTTGFSHNVNWPKHVGVNATLLVLLV